MELLKREGCIIFEHPVLKAQLKYLSWTWVTRFGLGMAFRIMVSLVPFLIHARRVLYCWDGEFIGDAVVSEQCNLWRKSCWIPYVERNLTVYTSDVWYMGTEIIVSGM